jgi:hypothetical protein
MLLAILEALPGFQVEIGGHLRPGAGLPASWPVCERRQRW